jgi:hypothetical protein
MSHEHKCYRCNKQISCEGSICFDRTQPLLCRECQLELVTSRLIVCLKVGRVCDDCDQDCALNENRERIKNNVK